MIEQGRGTIRQQIELPFMESVKISFQSLRIRFYRSIITTAGISLGIAFLVSVLTTAEVNSEIAKGSGQEEIFSNEEEEEEKGKGWLGISTKQLWLVTMSLIVCVVGIANAMLMSVTERFREIGTMKCLGALDGFIVRLFLLESAFQGFVGALIGALI
ncbi:TPA: FtsX-like permease family protein, partial [Candidatus Poribacteria bacterium]|nr:FtsX-like permease family protein [Candidatus Poribacteria bacterium]